MNELEAFTVIDRSVESACYCCNSTVSDYLVYQHIWEASHGEG